MDWEQLGAVASRALFVYVFLLVIVRILGKREVGNFTAFDLIVALMLGEVVDEIIYGDVEWYEGAVAIVVIAAVDYGISWASYLNTKLDNLLEGTPTVVVRNGALERAGLRRERINEKNLMAMLRQQGVDDMREVKLACIEVNGEISVILQDWAESIQKADLDPKLAREREDDTGGKSEPPPSHQTCSPNALKGTA